MTAKRTAARITTPVYDKLQQPPTDLLLLITGKRVIEAK